MSVRVYSTPSERALTRRSRPLPDERPRQSVANLIGRFEQQGKRQTSPSLPLVPRSSSVSSQTTTDPAKDEIKEWPPKPVADVNPVAPARRPSSPSPVMSASPVVVPQLIPDPPHVDIPTTPTPVSPEPVVPKPKPVAGGKSTPTTGTRRAVASPAKHRSPVAKPSVASPPPKTSLQSSVSQPLRPHHTGQSVTSNSSTTRHARPVPRTAPSTPSRPKSSVGQNQTVSRPKTPSSGLFAPTAASLARSRNALPPPPPPVKKVTLSSDAAERLSKPTAASLSKARVPVAATPSPVKASKSTSGTLRGPSKLKVARTPAKSHETTAVESGSTSVSSGLSHGSQQVVADRVENRHDSEAVEVGPPEDVHVHSEVASDAAHDSVPEAEVQSNPGHSDQPTGDLSAEEIRDEPVVQNLAEGEAVHDVRLEAHVDSVTRPAESYAGNGNGHRIEPAPSGNEIEDIVHMLEGTKPRPQSIVSIPDEDGDVSGAY